MRGFASKQKIDQLVHQLKKADCDEKRELPCQEFKKEVYQHFQLDRFENIKKSSWKNPMTKARNALKENGFEESVKYLTAEWNKRDLRDENGKWIEDREEVAKILKGEKRESKIETKNTEIKEQEIKTEDSSVDNLETQNETKKAETKEEEIKTEDNSVENLENTNETKTVEINEKSENVENYFSVDLSNIFSGETLERIQKAIKVSQCSQSEFIKRAIDSYAKNYEPHLDINAENMTNQELIGSKAKGTSEELISRAIDAIIEYNNSQPEKKNRYQISNTAIKQLTGCRQEIIRVVCEKYHNKIYDHHEDKVSHNRVWNRGKADIRSKIKGFKTVCEKKVKKIKSQS